MALFIEVKRIKLVATI